MSSVLSDEQQSVLEKVEKLLRLASKNPNEAEAASAQAKAQDLLNAYNLDLAAVEEHGGGEGKRLKEELEGGRFEWQRDLWKVVGQLNFCIVWHENNFVASPIGRITDYVKIGDSWRHMRGVHLSQFRIVGRRVNVAATKAMATYLQDVCDRLAKEECKANGEKISGRWANSFREGVAARIMGKVWERADQVMAEEAKKTMDAAHAKYDPNNVSLSKAVTLSSHKRAENDANVDFIYGEGTSAKWAAERAEKAAAKKAADDEYTRWAAANPEEAAKEERRRERECEKAERRHARSDRFKGDIGAYFAGYDKAKDVSIDRQAEGRKVAGLL